MRNILNLILIISLTYLFSGCTSSSVQKDYGNYFTSWEKGTSPEEVGAKAAHRFVETPHGGWGRTTPVKSIPYPEVCAWYGALTFAKENGDKNLLEKLTKKFEPFYNEESKLVPKPDHVDHSVFGSVPLEIYIQTKDERALNMGIAIADKQWENPDANGLTKQTRFWIDDMFMITALQVQAFRATNDEKYLNRAAFEMSTYLDTLQRENGLFYHAPDVPFFWGRGDGWVAAGMTELLRSMNSAHPLRNKIFDGYKKMMAALLKYQDNNGMWHQLIDKPELSWAETSSSAMFTFAFITGVKNGWLDAEIYGPAARKAWLGLIKYIDENSDIREVCIGTNKKNSFQYYIDRPRSTGDLHGQAPLLWCAAALLR